MILKKEDKISLNSVATDIYNVTEKKMKEKRKAIHKGQPFSSQNYNMLLGRYC